MKKSLTYLGIAAMALSLVACKPATQQAEEQKPAEGAELPVTEGTPPAEATAPAPEATNPTVDAAKAAVPAEATAGTPGTEATAAPVQETEKAGQ